jgi:hypothetical protein
LAQKENLTVFIDDLACLMSFFKASGDSSLKLVAREGHTAQGKIQILAFPLEISTSNWEESLFSFKTITLNKFDCWNQQHLKCNPLK